jgi:predicted amino acid-binding ACT domain protein
MKDYDNGVTKTITGEDRIGINRISHCLSEGSLSTSVGERE